MKQSDLKPAGEYAKRFFVKTLIYGPPGVGKTPLLNTAPRPVLCATEPGLLSMAGSGVLTWEAYTPERIEEFFEWAMNSDEAKNFDTFAIDSVSQMAETFLNEELNRKSRSGNKVDGKAAYGEMARRSLSILNKLYFAKDKHVVLLAKQEIEDRNGLKFFKPYFPGNMLNVETPHMFDGIWRYSTENVSGHGMVKVIRTVETFDCIARERSGKLADIEPPNLDYIFKKALA